MIAAGRGSEIKPFLNGAAVIAESQSTTNSAVLFHFIPWK